MKRKLFKLSLIFALCTSLIITAAGCSSKEKVIVNHVDYKYYPNLQELILSSDAIVLVRVKKVFAPREHNINLDKSAPPKNLVYTISEVEVLDSIRGSLTGTIRIKQAGGKLNGFNYVYEGTEYVKEKEQYVLFLRSFNVPNEPYSLLNPEQAMINISNNKPRINQSLSFVSTLRSSNDFIGDLKTISSNTPARKQIKIDEETSKKLLNK